MTRHILSTGQTFCADTRGIPIACEHSGQDAEFSPGLPWGSDRFRVVAQTVEDTLTGLTWLRDANAPGFPITWQEAFDFIDAGNRNGLAGHHDWRLPTRRELFSLITFDAHSPALPVGHPFNNVFQGWYWTATPSAMHPTQVWHVHMLGGRMFWGSRDGYELVWPVRGISPVLPDVGSETTDTTGVAWPEPRFVEEGDTVVDSLTGLIWTRSADIAGKSVTWAGAFHAIHGLNSDRVGGMEGWRLPTIRELESLTDAAHHSPALPPDHPFSDTREAYWSSTNSGFEHDWAMCYYLHKGAVGVGYKQDGGFHVWGVASPNA